MDRQHNRGSWLEKQIGLVPGVTSVGHRVPKGLPGLLEGGL